MQERGFYKRHMHIFEISMKRRIFVTPFDLPVLKEKKFHLILGSMCTFYELQSPNWRQPLNNWENVFYKQVLKFHRLFKIFMPDIWASKSPGPLLTNDADVTDDGETVAREPLCSPVLQALPGHKFPEAPGVGFRLRAKKLHSL
jgi:hypothetical protein